MAIDGEVMTIHQKIAEAHKRNKGQYGMGDDRPMRSFDAPKVSDIEEIKQVLQYILDKLHNMDKWMRSNLEPRYQKQYDAQAEEIKQQKALLEKVTELEEKMNGDDSKKADSGVAKDSKPIAGSGSCATRQGDFRAGNTGNPAVEQKDSNNTGTKKVNEPV